MPKFKPKPTDRVIEKEQKTNAGIYVTAGDIEHSDYDSKDWNDLQKDYMHMRDGHALISTTVEILKYPILMSEYRVDSKNKEAEDYIYWVFENLKKGFDYFKRHKLLALDFGLSMHEIIIRRGDKFNGKLTNRPVWFNPIQNETINKFYYNDQTMFIGIEHERRIPEKGSQFVDIEAKNIEYFTYNEEFNDIRGRAILRPVRLNWECEIDILTSTTTAIKRGAGIPIIYTKGDPGDADKANIEQIGRTICQMRNGYATANQERIAIDLVEPKSQQNVLPLLEYLDRHIFFNTMSQFMTSGIGGNGSRAATSEHKSSYELAANYILQALEVNMQALCDRIIGMSYLEKIPAIEYPRFHFNAINQVDLNKVAQNIKILLDSGAITKQREDEAQWRDMFGQPELAVTTEIVDPQKKPVSFFGEKDNEKNKTLGKKTRVISAEKLEFEDRVFSLESANEHYITIEEEVNELLEKKFAEYFKSIKEQLGKNRKRAITIRQSLIESTVDEISRLYDKGYNRGERDVKTEVKKIDNHPDTTELQLTPKQSQKKKDILSKLVMKLFTNTKTAIENKMNVVTDEFIAIKGGLDNYLTEFEAGFKRDKNNIKKSVESGYIDGRGETLMDIREDVKTFFVSTRLDPNICNECAPFDGSIMTFEELQSAGLNLVHPVNAFCLGGDNCRCVVIVFEFGRK